jgi:hypothetical protein
MAGPEGFILLAAFTPRAPVDSAPQAASDLPALPAFARLALRVSGLLVPLGSVRQARLDSDRAQASTHLDRFNVRTYGYSLQPEARSARDL